MLLPLVESGQYTSWVFGHRLREAGLLGSMGRVASSVDNTMMESFFSTLQRELLDTRTWPTCAELAAAIFEWIEAWYNPVDATPASATSLQSTTTTNSANAFTKMRSRRHDHHTTHVRETGSGSRPRSKPVCGGVS
jgi:Integrase core domain